MRPTYKNPELEAMLTRVSGSDRRVTIEAGLCRPKPMGCGAEIGAIEFRDIISVKEYRISGLCQDCQDKVFGFGPANKVSG